MQHKAVGKELKNDLTKHFGCDLKKKSYELQGFIQQFWEKPPGQNWEKNDRLNVKIGKNY